MRVWIEVENVAPEVPKRAHSAFPELAFQTLPVKVETPEFHVGRGFYDRPCGDEQTGIDVHAVPGPELPTRAHHHARNAIPKKHASRRGADHDFAPLAVVDHHRIARIEEVNLAVLAPVELELLAVDAPGGLDQRLAGSVFEDEIFLIKIRVPGFGRRGGHGTLDSVLPTGLGLLAEYAPHASSGRVPLSPPGVTTARVVKYQGYGRTFQ